MSHKIGFKTSEAGIVMINEYYSIKDKCRIGLLKYLGRAFSFIPKINNPKILDIGCGTGVPTIWMAENLQGRVTAIDTDKNSLDWLQEKIVDKNLDNQIITLNISFFDLSINPNYFDIILAEGFLNVVGFGQGFSRLAEMLRPEGYFLIHDEYRGHEKKYEFICKSNCKLIGSFFLDEGVWWNDYYKRLENEISAINVRRTRDLFKSDLEEIELYKKDAASFRSMYYIVQKQ